MSLLGMLGMTSRALDAQRYGLGVVGGNLANVNTPGYTKRVADFGAAAPADRSSAGSGVEVLGVRSMRDRLYDQRLFDELPLEQEQAAMADALGLAEVALGPAGASVDGALADFFDAFAQLAEAPTSPTARQRVVSEGQAVAGAFSGTASRLTDAARAADARIRQGLDEINGLTTRIAALNRAIASAPENQVLQLRDERTEVVKTLSGLLGTQVIEQSNGAVQVTTRNGRPLVIGESAFNLSATSTPPSGYAQVSLGGVDITAEIGDGGIGGLLQARDGRIPAYMARLDALAYDVATQVNAVHATGFDGTGAPGGPFFAAPAAAAGTAGTLTVSTAVSANPALVAAAGTAAPGDNQVARTLANLRDAPIVDGATPDGAWTQLVYEVGSDISRAETEQGSRREIVFQIEQLRDSVSGISIDEEAAMMLRFQRAYEANARFFTVVDETLQTLLALKR